MCATIKINLAYELVSSGYSFSVFIKLMALHLKLTFEMKTINAFDGLEIVEQFRFFFDMSHADPTQLFVLAQFHFSLQGKIFFGRIIT